METSRTKLRREVREKRLAYFEKSQSSHPLRLQEEEPLYNGTYQAHGPSKNSSKVRTKIGRDAPRKDKSMHQRMQQGDYDMHSGRDDTLTASALNARSGRPSSARQGVARPKYPQGPSGDDCKNVAPVQRKKNRPSSAISSSHGDHYRLDISDSTRLTGSSMRPSSAKASARPKRPLKDKVDTHHHKLSERPSTATAYRSSAESAKRQSEFEDFRKGARASSHYPAKKAPESKGGRSDKELQEFFRLREIRQRSRRDLSPSSSESGQDAGETQVYTFFRNEAKNRFSAPGSRSDLTKDEAFEGRSQSIEDGISRRVHSQWGSQVNNDALQASEFHSAYSAENMLQSLLGIRKVKAKLHDELLSSFLKNDNYKSILMHKRKTPRNEHESPRQSVPDLNGNKVEIDSTILKYHHRKSEELANQGGESSYELKQEETFSAIPAASINTSAYNVTGEEKRSKVSLHVESATTDERLDVSGPVSSTKDEGEESGVEMDDLNFDVGALCNAAKQGDDILRQYIRGLTEKVKAKEGKDSHPGEVVQEQNSAKSATKIKALFAPKMPERKYDVQITNASASEQATVPAPIQSLGPSYVVSDPMKEKELESAFEKDGLKSLNSSRQGLDRIDDDHTIDHSILSPKNKNNFDVKNSSEFRDYADPSASDLATEELVNEQVSSVNKGNKDRDLGQEPFSVGDSLQDDDGSVVSRVKEPAVTADLLEKLGLFDSNDTSYNPSPLKDQGEVYIGLMSHGADSATDDGFQLANRTLDDSDLGLETFRPDSRTISPLKEVRDYSKEGVLTTSHVDSPDLIEEFLDDPSKTPVKAETAALRRTYDLSEDVVTSDIADPNVNTPFHSHIQHSKNGVSFVFDPRSEEHESKAGVPNAEMKVSLQTDQCQENPKHGIAFEVDLSTVRKQPKPPPSSKPSNSRVMTSSRGSPKHISSKNSSERSRPRKSPRTPDAHRDEIRQYHEKNRRTRKLSSPRATGPPVKHLHVASESSSTSDNQPSLRISLPSNMDTDRPSREGIGHQAEVHDSFSEVEFGAPFLHSPRREPPLEDENEVLHRIASFNPPAAESHDTVSEIVRQHQVNIAERVHEESRDTLEQGSHQVSRPRPSSANPKRTAAKKPGNSRPTSAHSKMYSSPDKSYDRKWPQSSMAWMTQHKLTSSLIGGDQPDSDLTASGSKVKIGQTRVNREFARKGKPPVAVLMSKRDGEFVRVKSSKLFGGSVSRVLDGRGSAAVPPLTLQLIQDSPRGSESLSIWQLLPDEILLHIFSYLPQYMLVMCALTCQRFHRIAMDDSLWRTIRLENRDLTDFYLTYIGEKHPVSLTLHKCRGNLVTENGLRNLFRSCADSLQELNITGCSKGELQGDSILLHVSRCYNLSSLDASWCAVTDNGLSAILDGCPRLETICLNGCQSVSDQCLRQIVNKYGPNLEVLELCGCFNLSPQTLTHLAETSNQLLTLNIAQCYKITDDCIASVAPKFKSLQHWQLKGCKELRDSAVKKIARHCKNLRTLSIASCPHITDMSLIEIATYLNSIRSLDVSGCRKVGNEGMRCLATCCPYLEKVGLSSTSVTHKSVSSLASYTSQTLMELKLNCCREITEASVIRLLKHCKRLKTLHLYGVKGLRNLGILKVQYPCIEYLEKVRQI